MKILALIKAGLKKAGIPEKYAGKVQALFKIESEENLDNYIALFKDNILPDLENADASSQSAAEKAKKEAVEEYEKKYNLKEGKAIKTGKEEVPPTDELPPAVKSLIEGQGKQISELTNLVKGLTSTVSTSQKQASADTLFKEAKLPEKWRSRIDVNAEKSVEDQIKDLQEEYTELRQGIIDDQVEAGNYRPTVATPKDRTEEEWGKLMNGDDTSKQDSSVASLNMDN